MKSNFPPVRDLLNKLDVEAKDLALFEQAFTHSSFANETGITESLDYERLETLGDAVLSLIVIELGYQFRPDFLPGTLTLMRNDFVQSNSLINYADELGFLPYIRTSKGSPVQANRRILEDVFEAFLGAMYLDAGLSRVKKFVSDIMLDDIKSFVPNQGQNRDYKSELQMAFQADKKKSVEYTSRDLTFNSQDPLFEATVSFEGTILGIGEGRTKKAAEQNAAAAALDKLAR